jgi:hypothetical protein
MTVWHWTHEARLAGIEHHLVVLRARERCPGALSVSDMSHGSLVPCNRCCDEALVALRLEAAARALGTLSKSLVEAGQAIASAMAPLGQFFDVLLSICALDNGERGRLGTAGWNLRPLPPVPVKANARRYR